LSDELREGWGSYLIPVGGAISPTTGLEPRYFSDEPRVASSMEGEAFTKASSILSDGYALGNR
jgi:hypothetical protein